MQKRRYPPRSTESHMSHHLQMALESDFEFAISSTCPPATKLNGGRTFALTYRRCPKTVLSFAGAGSLRIFDDPPGPGLGLAMPFDRLGLGVVKRGAPV